MYCNKMCRFMRPCYAKLNVKFYEVPAIALLSYVSSLTMSSHHHVPHLSALSLMTACGLIIHSLLMHLHIGYMPYYTLVTCFSINQYAYLKMAFKNSCLKRRVSLLNFYFYSILGLLLKYFYY